MPGRPSAASRGGSPPANPRRNRLRRFPGAPIAAGLALVVVVVAAVLVLGGGSSYRVHARFADAGQLVKGDLVEVGGRPIGTVGKIGLSDDGQADVELKLTESAYQPLHRGTIARIRTVGLSGVANRYIDLTAGKDDAPEIPDGGVLSASETRAVVDLDELLNDLDGPTRARLQRIVGNGAKIYGGDGSDANRVLAYLNPALSQTRAISDDITQDAAAVDRLVSSSSQVLGVLSQRRGDVEGSLVNTAATLRALAGARSSLQQALARAPAVLGQARGTLGRVRGTLQKVRPVIRELRPSARPLARTLRETVPTGRAVDPVAEQLRGLVPNLKLGLSGLPATARDSIPALASTTSAVREAMPIFAGIRPYAPDVVAGIFQGFGGLSSQSYDANGHVVRIAPTIGLGGAGGLLSLFKLLPDGKGFETGVTARCPGAATQAAADGSNPFTDDDALCDKGQTTK